MAINRSLRLAASRSYTRLVLSSISGSGHFLPGHIPPGHFPTPPGQSPSFLNGVKHFSLLLPPSAIYTITRFTINVHKIDSGRSVRDATFQKILRSLGRLGLGSRVVGWLESGLWVSGSFQKIPRPMSQLGLGLGLGLGS